MSNGRKYLIAGNWKMNIPSSDAGPLITGITDVIGKSTKVDILICPPFTSIHAAKESLDGSTNIFLGAQNFFPEKNGAYTGEISAVMLRELGVSHVIVGHSERRAILGEDDRFIGKKVRCALGSSLIPILCVGETLEQRENGQEFEIIRAQLRDCLRGVSTVEAGKLVIAYEPIWAIGTGETATPEIAQKTHAFIRSILTELFDSKAANAIKILYGGSMKPDNAEALLSKDDVDGGLIGGASLNHKSFAEIIKIAGKLSN